MALPLLSEKENITFLQNMIDTNIEFLSCDLNEVLNLFQSGNDIKVKVSDQTCRSLEVDTVDLTGNKAFTGDDSYLAKTYKTLTVAICN